MYLTSSSLSWVFCYFTILKYKQGHVHDKSSVRKKIQANQNGSRRPSQFPVYAEGETRKLLVYTMHELTRHRAEEKRHILR